MRAEQSASFQTLKALYKKPVMTKKANQLNKKMSKRKLIAFSLNQFVNQFEIAVMNRCMVSAIRSKRSRLMICRMIALIGLFSSFILGNSEKRILRDVKAKSTTATIPVFAAFNHAAFVLAGTFSGRLKYIDIITLTPKNETDAIVAEMVHRSLMKDFI